MDCSSSVVDLQVTIITITTHKPPYFLISNKNLLSPVWFLTEEAQKRAKMADTGYHMVSFSYATETANAEDQNDGAPEPLVEVVGSSQTQNLPELVSPSLDLYYIASLNSSSRTRANKP
jgi:hypothetical protein